MSLRREWTLQTFLLYMCCWCFCVPGASHNLQFLHLVASFSPRGAFNFISIFFHINFFPGQLLTKRELWHACLKIDIPSVPEEELRNINLRLLLFICFGSCYRFRICIQNTMTVLILLCSFFHFLPFEGKCWSAEYYVTISIHLRWCIHIIFSFSQLLYPPTPCFH